MKNLILAQVLGGLFGSAMQRRRGGGMGMPQVGGTGGLGGALGGAAITSILAGMLGRRGAARGGIGGKGALIAMLLPFAMQWVERNGGLGAVLKRFQDKGYGRQANSWVATGDNQDIDEHAIDEVIGPNELSRLSQELGVAPEEVRQGFAEILPEMVNQLTPEGQLSPEADDVLHESIPLIEQELKSAQQESSTT